MRVSFWGVRGSLPAPKQGNWRYGGNTPCLEVRAGDDLLILDAGSGVQDLGQELAEGIDFPSSPPSLLFTHYHWDHVQGLPFFAPLYRSGNALKIFGPRPKGNLNLEGVLQALFRPPFFPVSADRLSATLHFEEVKWRSSFTLGGVHLRTCRLHHPQGALAYRLEQDGASIVYATDHEPGDPVCDHALRQLARGADLLISDAQYSPEELKQKAGWGHGSWEASVAIARDAGVKSLVLFHHDPFRTDGEIDEFVSCARRDFAHTWAAREGMFIDVSRERVLVGQASLTSVERLETNERPAVGSSPASLELEWDEAWSSENSAPKGNGTRAGEELVGVFAPLSERAAPPPVARVNGNVSGGAIGSLSTRPNDQSRGGQRRSERISLDSVNAYGVLQNGVGAKVLRALDVSSGGVSFLVDEPPALPEIFDIRLTVPVLPVAEFRIRRVYTQPLSPGMWRVGCSFAA